MRKPSCRHWLAAIAIVGVCFFVGKRMFWLPALNPHQGDGLFANTSWRAGPFAVPGYSITMPEFDLAQPFQAEYHVTRLPSIGRDCMVYLAFRDPKGTCGDARAMTHGDIRLELVDNRGAPLVRVSGKPSEFIWYGCREMHGLYQMRRSSFFPSPREKYTVRVSYEPEPGLASFKGYVYLECGGHL